MSGFGPPPGGGFGSPPGGGWGPPAGGGAPPDGGGFGPPPGGPPSHGFGPGPSGPAPGELAHIPFSADDLKNIGQLATLMMASGGLLLLGAGLSIISGLVTAITMSSGGGGVCGGTIHLGVAIALAACLFLGAKSLKLVVTTDEADQKHLGDGLAQLRNYFMVKGVVFALGIVLVCLCCGFALFLGGMMGALMHR